MADPYREPPAEQTAKDAELEMLRNERWWQVYIACMGGFSSRQDYTLDRANIGARRAADLATGRAE